MEERIQVTQVFGKECFDIGKHFLNVMLGSGEPNITFKNMFTNAKTVFSQAHGTATTTVKIKGVSKRSSFEMERFFFGPYHFLQRSL